MAQKALVRLEVELVASGGAGSQITSEEFSPDDAGNRPIRGRRVGSQIPTGHTHGV